MLRLTYQQKPEYYKRKRLQFVISMSFRLHRINAPHKSDNEENQRNENSDKVEDYLRYHEHDIFLFDTKEKRIWNEKITKQNWIFSLSLPYIEYAEQKQGRHE